MAEMGVSGGRDAQPAVGGDGAGPPPPGPQPDAGVWQRVCPDRPNEAWDQLRLAGVAAHPAAPPPARAPGSVRVVCVSDTHGHPVAVPDGDVLVHAGDWSMTGEPEEVARFAAWLRSLPHRHKIVIAGNHDLTIDPEWYQEKWRRFHTERADVEACRRAVASAAIFLEDSAVDVMGLSFWGSPWQPEFCDWAFNLARGEACAEKWRRIPTNVDVLVTHGPPIGHGDLCASGHRAGCVDLLREITLRARPRYHVFGHIHEGYGTTTDGVTTYVNASTCTLQYDATNPPIVLDIDPVRRDAPAAPPAAADAQQRMDAGT